MRDDDIRPERQDDVIPEIWEVLEDFRGEESVKSLFWEVLSFDRQNQPLRLSLMGERAQGSFQSLRIFASSPGAQILLAESLSASERGILESACRWLKTHFHACLMLTHDTASDAWQLIYPDDTKTGLLRILPLPGNGEDRWQVAQALASLDAEPSGGADVTWLDLARRLEALFPGVMPRKRTDLKEIRAYIDAISRYSLLTAQQERGEDNPDDKMPPDGCAWDYQTWRLIAYNLRLVVWVAGGFPRIGMQFEDLIQEGNLGLIIAAFRFDPSRGTRFSTYAVHWIRQKIRRALSENSNLIRWPYYKVPDIIRANLNGRYGDLAVGERFVTPLLEEEMREIEQWEDDTSLPTERLSFTRADTAYLSILLKMLDPREARVIRMRYGLSGAEPMTLQQLAEEMDLTRERVRQIERDALQKLRKLVRARANEDAILNGGTA